MKITLSLKAVCMKCLIDSIWLSLNNDKCVKGKEWNFGFDPYDVQYKLPLFGPEVMADDQLGLIKNESLSIYKHKILAIIEYLNLTIDLKEEVAHVMKTQFTRKLLNIFHMAFMIEMGFDTLILKGYIYSPKYSSTLTELLSHAGKKNIKKLNLRLRDRFDDKECVYGRDYLTTQLIKSVEMFTNITEFIDHCGYCTDNVLKIITDNLVHLVKIDIYFSKISDRGISHLTSSDSIKSKLTTLSLQDTLVSSRGVLEVLQTLMNLEDLECVNPKYLMSVLPPQKFLFPNIKNLSLTIAAQTWTENGRLRLPFLFPNLLKFSFNFLPTDDSSFFSLVFLCRLQYLNTLELLAYRTNLQLKIFTCKNVPGAVGTNGLFQMHNVKKLRLFGFSDICISRILGIWPNLEYFSIANCLHCSCLHNKGENCFGENVKHANIISKSPMDYLTCFPNMKTLVLTIQDSKNNILNIDVTSKLSRNLTHVSLTCHSDLIRIILNHWLKYCADLRVLNLSQQDLSVNPVRHFISKRQDVKVTFEDLFIIMPTPFEYWYKEEIFSPCSLCQAFDCRYCE